MGKTKMPILTGGGGTEIKNGQIVEGYALDGEIDAGMFVEKKDKDVIDGLGYFVDNDSSNRCLNTIMLSKTKGLIINDTNYNSGWGLKVCPFRINDDSSINFGSWITISNGFEDVPIVTGLKIDESNCCLFVTHTKETGYYGGVKTGTCSMYPVNVSDDYTATVGTQVIVYTDYANKAYSMSVISIPNGQTCLVGSYSGLNDNKAYCSAYLYTVSLSTTPTIKSTYTLAKQSGDRSGSVTIYDNCFLYYLDTPNTVILNTAYGTAKSTTPQNMVFNITTDGQISLGQTITNVGLAPFGPNTSKYDNCCFNNQGAGPIFLNNNALAIFSNYALTEASISELTITGGGYPGNYFKYRYYEINGKLYSTTDNGLFQVSIIYDSTGVPTGLSYINKEVDGSILAALRPACVQIIDGSLIFIATNVLIERLERFLKTYIASSTSIAGVTQEKITATKPGDITILKEGN